MTTLLPRQIVASVILCIFLMTLIVRLVQKGKLDIAYCWVWLGIGIGAFVTVVKYDWLVKLSTLIGSLTPTTTLFILAFLVILLICLQFSLVISSHRRQLKRLSQQLAILSAEKNDDITAHQAGKRQDS